MNKTLLSLCCILLSGCQALTPISERYTDDETGTLVILPESAYALLLISKLSIQDNCLVFTDTYGAAPVHLHPDEIVTFLPDGLRFGDKEIRFGEIGFFAGRGFTPTPKTLKQPNCSGEREVIIYSIVDIPEEDRATQLHHLSIE